MLFTVWSSDVITVESNMKVVKRVLCHGYVLWLWPYNFMTMSDAALQL